MRYIFLASKNNLKNYITRTVECKMPIQAFKSMNIINYESLMQMCNQHSFFIHKFIILNNNFNIDIIKHIMLIYTDYAHYECINDNKFLSQFIIQKKLIPTTYYLLPVKNIFGLIRTINLDIVNYFPNYVFNLIKKQYQDINNCYWIYCSTYSKYIQLAYVYNSILYGTDIIVNMSSLQLLPEHKDFINIYDIKFLNEIKTYIQAQEFLESLNSI